MLQTILYGFFFGNHNLDYQGFGAKMTCQILVMAKEKTRICVLAWCYVVEMMGFEPTTPTLRT